MGSCVSKALCATVPNISPNVSPVPSRRNSTGNLDIRTENAAAVDIDIDLPRRTSSSSKRPRAASLDLSEVATKPSQVMATSQVLKEAKSTSAKNIDPAVASKSAPVKLIGEDEFKGHVKQLRRDIQGWQAGSLGLTPALEDRVAQTRNFLNRLTEPSDTNLGYFVGSRAMGLMGLRQVGNEIEIESIASHPATTGVGGSLIEHAVNHSEQNDCGGIVRLTPVDTARAAYEALGFTSTADGDHLRLDPKAATDLWSKEDGSWRLRRHENEAYVVGLKESAPIV